MKKTRLYNIILLITFLELGTTSVFALPPTYDNNFAGAMTKWHDGVSVWNPDNGKVKGTNTLTANLKAIIEPGVTQNNGFMERILKTFAIGMIIAYLVRAGAQLLVSGNKAEDLKKAAYNLLYISIGAVFIYCAGWLFSGDGLINFSPGGTAGLEEVGERINNGNNSLFFQILTLLKGIAFFFAILMIVVTGFKVVSAADADKSKKLVKGVINVVGALAIIKIVDFIYYIASVNDFAQQATDFILTAAKFFGYLYGSAAVLMVFYAGYSFLTDGGGGDGFKRAKNILINLLLSGLVLFGFLLILYQVFAEFT